MVNYLYRADVGVVPVKAASHIRFPGKVFDYLASGLSLGISAGIQLAET
jgi:hypothetical protein